MKSTSETENMTKRKLAHFSALNSSSLVILSADVLLPLTGMQGNMKEQTMNMTKCETPQPLSRSQLPGSRKDGCSISSMWEESRTIFCPPGNLSTFSQPESYGGFTLDLREEKKSF